MLSDIILIPIFLIAAGLFLSLGKKHDQNKWVFAFLGFATFLVGIMLYVVLQIGLFHFFNLYLGHFPQIPFAIVFYAQIYLFIDKSLSAKSAIKGENELESMIDDIGKSDDSKKEEF